MELIHSDQKWLVAFKDVWFRKKLSVGLILLFGVILLMPSFFHFVESRNGYSFNDILLRTLAPKDVSLFIFICIWSLVLLFIFRSLNDPELFLLYLYCYLFLCLCRFITITAVPLNPPEGLIELRDPIGNYFYGSKKFITRDLFFSGHTATISLLSFCFRTRIDKTIAALGALLVGCFLLVQHVHYTIDVIAAPFFSALCYLLARKIVNWQPTATK